VERVVEPHGAGMELAAGEARCDAIEERQVRREGEEQCLTAADAKLVQFEEDGRAERDGEDCVSGAKGGSERGRRGCRGGCAVAEPPRLGGPHVRRVAARDSGGSGVGGRVARRRDAPAPPTSCGRHGRSMDRACPEDWTVGQGRSDGVQGLADGSVQWDEAGLVTFASLMEAQPEWGSVTSDCARADKLVHT
jgi:hypothetical protein